MTVNFKEKYDGFDTAAKKYEYIELAFASFKGATMPLSFRKVVQAQLSQETRADGSLGDDRSIRIKLIMAATSGLLFTLAGRIIRIAVVTLALPIAVPVRCSTAARIQGNIGVFMKEFFRRYGEEWVDLGVTVVSFPIALIKVIKPSAGSSTINKITGYYLERATRRAAFDQSFKDLLNGYTERARVATQLRNEAQQAVRA